MPGSMPAMWPWKTSSLYSGSVIRWVSRPSCESNRQTSTFSACAEKRAKFAPSSSSVTPSGLGLPSVTRWSRMNTPSDSPRDADRVEPGIDSRAPDAIGVPARGRDWRHSAAGVGTQLARPGRNAPGRPGEGDVMRPISILARTAILAASAAFATSALAADQPMTRAEERAYRAELEKERERLEQVLSRVTDRSEFASAIVAEGYRLAAVNADEPDYLEFEIVKDR